MVLFPHLFAWINKKNLELKINLKQKKKGLARDMKGEQKKQKKKRPSKIRVDLVTLKIRIHYKFVSIYKNSLTLSSSSSSTSVCVRFPLFFGVSVCTSVSFCALPSFVSVRYCFILFFTLKDDVNNWWHRIELPNRNLKPLYVLSIEKQPVRYFTTITKRRDNCTINLVSLSFVLRCLHLLLSFIAFSQSKKKKEISHHPPIHCAP